MHNSESEAKHTNRPPLEELLISLRDLDFTVSRNARRIIRLSQSFWLPESIPPLSICLNQKTNKSLYYLVENPSSEQLKASISITEPGIDQRQGSASMSGIGALIMPRDGIASGEWYFESNHDEVTVTSALVVRGKDREHHGDNYQSRGYGTGILLLNNLLIQDILKKYSSFFEHKSVTAVIDAQAHIYGEPHHQITEWTVKRARALGYSNTDGANMFKKIFQFNAT